MSAEIDELTKMVDIVVKAGLITEVVYEYAGIIDSLGADTDAIRAFATAMSSWDL